MTSHRPNNEYNDTTMIDLRFFKQRLPFFLLAFVIIICKAHAFSFSAGKLKFTTTAPQFVELTTGTKMVFRRSKTHRVPQVSASDEDDSGNVVYHDQLALTRLYRGVSMLYFGQIIMSFKKSGLTLNCFNFVGGPLMASGVTFLLGHASEKQCLAMDTFKKLNGLLVLYATLCLTLVGLVPQLHEPFVFLFLTSGTSTLFVGTKGYFAGLRADGNVPFLEETLRLSKGAASTTLSLPPKITYGEVASLWCIAARKLRLAVGVVQVLLTVGMHKSQIVPKISELAKLTILGGSLVTTISIEDIAAKNIAYVPLNLMLSYVLGTMAGKEPTLWLVW
eukprot:scaffold1784_cov116-Cylindrotheca_fusiformis.AAC.10